MTITSGMVPNTIFCHLAQLLFSTLSCIMLLSFDSYCWPSEAAAATSNFCFNFR